MPLEVAETLVNRIRELEGVIVSEGVRLTVILSIDEVTKNQMKPDTTNRSKYIMQLDHATTGLVRRCQHKRRWKKCNSLMEYVGSSAIAGSDSMFFEDWYCKNCNLVHRVMVIWKHAYETGVKQ